MSLVFDWWTPLDFQLIKAVVWLRCVSVGGGPECVTNFGTGRKRLWSATNLDILLQVLYNLV